MEGQFLAMWTDVQLPTDISLYHGNFYVSQLTSEGRPSRISILDKEGKTLARWDSRSAHGLWVDAHGDIYLALTQDRSVDKYVRQR